MAATENLQQSEQYLHNYAAIWLPHCVVTPQNLGIVDIDGQTLQVTANFIRICAQHSIFVVTDASHTRMLMKVADLGNNRLLKTRNAREFTF